MSRPRGPRWRLRGDRPMVAAQPDLGPAYDAVRGRYPCPLWDGGPLGWCLISRPAVRWIGDSLDTLARALA